MIIVEDRAPYPPDQVVKELEGKFGFVLFDSKASKLLLARDRDGSVQLYWGTAADGSLVCTDDPNVISASCGKCYTPFPPVTKNTRAGGPAEGAHLHIVHLADARSSLQLIKEAKSRGDCICVETCPQTFSAEEIPDGDTRFKCASPICGADNKHKLWAALLVLQIYNFFIC